MRVYLPCPKRKGTPKVALDVCKVCRFNAKCMQFQIYRNPPLFPS